MNLLLQSYLNWFWRLHLSCIRYIWIYCCLLVILEVIYVNHILSELSIYVILFYNYREGTQCYNLYSMKCTIRWSKHTSTTDIVESTALRINSTEIMKSNVFITICTIMYTSWFQPSWKLAQPKCLKLVSPARNSSWT